MLLINKQKTYALFPYAVIVDTNEADVFNPRLLLRLYLSKPVCCLSPSALPYTQYYCPLLFFFFFLMKPFQKLM